MSVRPSKEFSPFRFFVPFFTLLVICYFAFHAFQGQYGIRSDMAMRKEIASLEMVLAKKVAERQVLENKVKPLIIGDDFDIDMIDEQLRKQLNLVKGGELIIWRNYGEN